MSNLLAYGSQLVGGAGGSGGGGGHVIEDATGTELTQQPTMQFTGYLSAEDDATNSKTVISAAPTTVEWSDWAEMTDAQKEGTHWLVVNAPNVGGQIDTNLLTKLWENPDPTVAFASQNITLASDDYDFLLFLSKNYSTGTEYNLNTIVRKGADALISYSNAQNNGILVARRYINRSSDTVYSAQEAYTEQGSATSPTLNNQFIIPIAIYGFKKTIHIDTTALIANVSTDARKCMLSNETSVEDAIDELATKPSTVIAGVVMGSSNNYITINYNFPVNVNTVTITKVFCLGINAQTVSIPCTIARNGVVSDIPAGTVLVYAIVTDSTIASNIRQYASSATLEITYN